MSNVWKRELKIPTLISQWPFCLIVVLAVMSWPAMVLADEFAIGECRASYSLCLEDWKARRLEYLRSERGYLNLAGLFWLKDGPNTFGGSSVNDLVFPGITTRMLGTFTLKNDQIMMIVDSRNDVQVGGKTAVSVVMKDDTAPAPTVANHGTLSWTIIRRDNQFAVRLRDFANPALANFQPIDYYPADEAYRVNAILHRYPSPRVLKVDTVISGLDYNPWSPGVVRFELGGKRYELEAYDAGTELLFVFGDQTTGSETYPAGRFLYARQPGDTGELVLDFNTAQNPPCAFNEFATCPIASARNRLAVPIPAGEKFDPAGH